jgi:hypothetical protein
MKDQRCGCCTGTEPRTPLPTTNRPGLDTLRYRVGTHAAFLDTMLARLSGHSLPDEELPYDRLTRPLKRLTTRTPDDPAIALLDAWATVADVLTFYQERIANEGYLPTATERRSIHELARLVGYELRPGVAASVYLAFTLEKDFAIDIPAGTRAQSIPEPDELPQMFETDEALPARTEWNAIAARRTRPHFLVPDTGFDDPRSFRLQGAVNDLKASGALLFVCGSFVRPYTIHEVAPDPKTETTTVTYVPLDTGFEDDQDEGPIITTAPAAHVAIHESDHGFDQGPTLAPLARLAGVVQALRKEPSLPPPSRFQLARPPAQIYSAGADLGPQLLVQFNPALAATLYAAYASVPVAAPGAPEPCRVEALRVRAAPFGHNAPLRRDFSGGTLGNPVEWTLTGVDRAANVIHLDAVYDGILPGSHVVVSRVDQPQPTVTVVERVRTVSRADYGISARVTQLVLRDAWRTGDEGSLSLFRGTTIYTRSEPLDLAEELIETDVDGDTIELDGLYDGLEAGRWLVVSGVRTDVPGAGDDDEPTDVEASELVMLAGVVHDVHRIPLVDGGEVELPTDTLHTRLVLAEPLAYSYRRDSVKVNANVVRATHGETREEVLGSGHGATAFQEFPLKHSPLTYVAAPTPTGVESTLEVRVNGVRWPARKSLLDLGAADRGYVTRRDDDDRTMVLFGDGERGARLPTGVENVTAVYRSGIGKAANVDADRISVLATRPLGVKEVINPQRASGGADAESRDQARRNVPLAVLALDRLVSVQDYADFARTFAGIGKARAASLSDGRREVVHLTVAGADDIPIDASSDLHRNLMLALHRFGDPNVPVQLALREAVFVFISARVKVLDDHLWSHVEPLLREKLLEVFGFDRRELGQDVLLGEVIGVMQAVEGVDWVDVDLLDAISETDAADPAALAEKLEALGAAADTTTDVKDGDQPRQRIVVQSTRVDTAATDPDLRIRPAQLAYLNPELPDSLILTEAIS